MKGIGTVQECRSCWHVPLVSDLGDSQVQAGPLLASCTVLNGCFDPPGENSVKVTCMHGGSSAVLNGM